MGRTYLTTAPGVEPTSPADARGEVEAYVPALAIPSEPRVPGRFRRLWTALALVALLVAFAYGWYRVATIGQDFDPALDPAFIQPAPGDESPIDDEGLAPPLDDDGHPLLPD